MKVNIKLFDRVVRLIFGIGCIGMLLFAADDLVLETVFGLAGLYLIITSIVGICPLYQFLNINSSQKNKPFY